MISPKQQRRMAAKRRRRERRVPRRLIEREQFASWDAPTRASSISVIMDARQQIYARPVGGSYTVSMGGNTYGPFPYTETNPTLPSGR